MNRIRNKLIHKYNSSNSLLNGSTNFTLDDYDKQLLSIKMSKKEGNFKPSMLFSPVIYRQKRLNFLNSRNNKGKNTTIDEYKQKKKPKTITTNIHNNITNINNSSATLLTNKSNTNFIISNNLMSTSNNTNELTNINQLSKSKEKYLSNKNLQRVNSYKHFLLKKLPFKLKVDFQKQIDDDIKQYYIQQRLNSYINKDDSKIIKHSNSNEKGKIPFYSYLSRTKGNELPILLDPVLISNNEFSNLSEESRYFKILAMFDELKKRILNDEENSFNIIKKFLYEHGIKEEELLTNKYLSIFRKFIQNDVSKFIDPNDQLENIIRNVLLNYQKYIDENYHTRYRSNLPKFESESDIRKWNIYGKMFNIIKLNNHIINKNKLKLNKSENKVNYQFVNNLVINKIKMDTRYWNKVSFDVSKDFEEHYGKIDHKDGSFSDLYNDNMNLYITEVKGNKKKFDRAKSSLMIYSKNNCCCYNNRQKSRLAEENDKNNLLYYENVKKSKKITEFAYLSQLRKKVLFNKLFDHA